MGRNHHGFLLSFTLLSASFALSLCLTSCGGNTQYQAPRDPVPAQVAAEIDSLPMNGVDAAVAKQLKEELRRVLAQCGTAKAPSTPPCTVLNQVSDLQAVDDGGGGVNLSWSYRSCGDYDQNGEVNVADLTEIGRHFEKNILSPDWDEARLADGDGNTEVNVSDITPIGVHFNNQVAGYKVFRCMDPGDCPVGVDDPNGSGAGEAAQAAMPGAPTGPGGELQFEANAADHTDGMYYWVRPYDAGGALGARSNVVQLGLPDLPWTHTWGLAKQDSIRDIAVDSDNNIYAVGYTRDPDEPTATDRMLLLKYDSEGQLTKRLIWSLGGNSTYGIGIELDDSDGPILFGQTDREATADKQLFVQRLNSQGIMQWCYLTGGNDDEYGGDLLLHGNDIYFTGTTNSLSPVAEVLLVKMDINGAPQWERSWVGAGPCYDPRLAYRNTMLGDTVYMACATQSPEMRLAVVRYNTDGVLIDQHALEMPNIDVRPVGMRLTYNRYTNATKVYIAARYSNGNDRMLLTAFDGTFTPLFVKTWRLNNNLYPTGLLLDSAGGMTITAQGPGLSPGTTLAYICRFDRDGASPIAAEYYEVTDAASRLYCAANYRGGLLVAGYAPNAGGSWQDVSGTSGTLSNEWKPISGLGGSEAFVFSQYYTEPETAPIGTTDAGAGYDDAFIAYRGMPE